MSEQTSKPNRLSIRERAKLGATALAAGALVMAISFMPENENSNNDQPARDRSGSTEVEAPQSSDEINLPSPPETIVDVTVPEATINTNTVTTLVSTTSVDMLETPVPQVSYDQEGDVIPQIGTAISIVPEEGAAAVQNLQQPTLNSVAYEDVAAPEQLVLPTTEEVAVGTAPVSEQVAVGEAPVPQQVAVAEAPVPAGAG